MSFIVFSFASISSANLYSHKGRYLVRAPWLAGASKFCVPFSVEIPKYPSRSTPYPKLNPNLHNKITHKTRVKIRGNENILMKEMIPMKEVVVRALRANCVKSGVFMRMGIPIGLSRVNWIWLIVSCFSFAQPIFITFISCD